MKKITALCVAVLLLVGVLAGCGDNELPASSAGEDTTTTTAPSDTTDTTTDTSAMDGSTTDIFGTDPSDTIAGDDWWNDTTTEGDWWNDTTAGDDWWNDTTTEGDDWWNDTTTEDNAMNTTTTTQSASTTTGLAKPIVNIDTDAVLAPFVNATPKVKYVTSYDPIDPAWKNIKAITYDGANIGSSKTKVFAYIGFPEGASATNKVPAIVLVHGGGGHAFAEWVKIWNDRGYAAIAMDTTGFFPSEKGKGTAGKETDDVYTMWHYGLYGEFAEAGYTNAPNNDEMKSTANPVDQQWIYHSIASTMIAHNILQADSRVDGSKIGITGISWGGVITSLAIGYDNDYAFAIPIYGSGYLNEGHGWMGPIFSEMNTKKTWSAADRFSRVDFPALWLCWAKDPPFSVNSNSKSYVATKQGGSAFSAKVNWNHSHGSGWAPIESYLFADSIVGKRAALTKVTKEPTVTKNADGTYAVTMTIAPDTTATKISARAAYITDSLSYTSKDGGHPTMDQTWKAAECVVNANGTITCTLPKTAVDFYVLITTKNGTEKYDISSQLIQGINK